MKTILISILGFITALLFAYSKGKRDLTIENKIKENEEVIKIIKDKQETDLFIDTLSDEQLDNELLKWHK